ncbi:hypothetical protein OS493_007989 [Desmophyllum pertusum]|uniref:Amino acid transporter transmembrane domain-containing protein n=1 Tax=Desmophyllum pertusum TaxID=174260 RepID=A0A9X0CGB3_9CNID|nr:hypothetical protein OS493_007989 [Desmophyllum pertusum]
MNSGDAQTSVDDVSTRKEKPCPDKGSINLNPVTDEEEPLLQPSNGVGFLAIPFAVAKGGIAAVAALIFYPFICWFTNRILVECLYEPDVLHGNIRVRSSWNEIGKAMWPQCGGTIHFVKLAQRNTPIHPWNIPNLPKEFSLSVKRDDLTGCALSGNKVRKLEFVLAGRFR